MIEGKLEVMSPKTVNLFSGGGLLSPSATDGSYDIFPKEGTYLSKRRIENISRKRLESLTKVILFISFPLRLHTHLCCLVTTLLRTKIEIHLNSFRKVQGVKVLLS